MNFLLTFDANSKPGEVLKSWVLGPNSIWQRTINQGTVNQHKWYANAIPIPYITLGGHIQEVYPESLEFDSSDDALAVYFTQLYKVQKITSLKTLLQLYKVAFANRASKIDTIVLKTDILELNRKESEDRRLKNIEFNINEWKNL